MHLALWIVQGLLCAMFLYIGSLKVFAYEKYKAMTEKQSGGRGSGLSKSMITFIGAAELAGAIGLVVPAATGIAPELTTLAAIGLGVIMILAIAFHVRRSEPATPAIVLLLLSGFIAAGRLLS
jgi:hypothetical protein